MKTLCSILFFFFAIASSAEAQQFVVDTTRFVGSGILGWAETNYAIPTRDGGILFVGGTDCFIGGGNIPSSPQDTSAESNPSNVLIGKLDRNMQLSWVKVYGGNWDDGASYAVQTPDGGYAVLGTTFSNNRDVSGNHGVEDGDLWLVKIDSLGNLLWQKCYGSLYDEGGFSMALTPDNGFILLGVSNGAGDDVPTHYSGSEFDYDWFVVKTDSIGNKQWTKSIGGTGDENPYGSILPVGNSYYLISSSNSTNYDCVDTAWHPGVGTDNDYYVFKLDSAGNKLWDSSYGSTGGEEAYNAVWDSRDSSIVINGVTTGNNYLVSGNHGEWDMWVIKINGNGTLLWQKCLGGPKAEIGIGIALSQDGYIAYGSTVPGDIGEQDGWVFAIDATSNQIADTQIGGAGYEDIASILPFKNDYIATGTSASVAGFTAGVNVGYLPDPSGTSFFSYMKYWPLAISEISNGAQKMEIYPNPASSFIRIPIPGNGSLSIYNCIGEIIYSDCVRQEKYTDVNIANWADGLYIVKWQGEDGTVLVNKFIKN